MEVTFSNKYNIFWWDVEILFSRILSINIFFARIDDSVRILSRIEPVYYDAMIVIGIAGQVGLARISYPYLSGCHRL